MLKLSWVNKKPRGGGFCLKHWGELRLSLLFIYSQKENAKTTQQGKSKKGNGGVYLTNKEFREFINGLREYLEKEKAFVQNPIRMQEVNRAMEIINELFPDCAREIKDDPLQMGAVILDVKGSSMVVRGERELALFAELTSLIDNFEVYPEGENFHFAAVMREAFVRIQEGK